jgi:hypothetical protein
MWDTTPCPHDARDSVNTKIEARWGEMKCVDEIVYSDVDGVFTYGVEFEKGKQMIVCGHDISEYPRAMRKEIRWVVKYDCCGAPHYLGEMMNIW